MITDALMGLMVFGDASLRRNNLDAKSRFIEMLRMHKLMPNDGSYENFDVAVRTTYKEFRRARPDTQVGLWVNEVVTLLDSDLPLRVNQHQECVVVDFSRYRH